MKDTHRIKLSEKYIDIYKDKKILKKHRNLEKRERERGGGGGEREK